MKQLLLSAVLIISASAAAAEGSATITTDDCLYAGGFLAGRVEKPECVLTSGERRLVDNGSVTPKVFEDEATRRRAPDKEKK